MSLSVKSLLFPLFAAAALLTACNGDDPEEDFPNATGIDGRVLVQNEFGQPLYNERNGISVLLETGFRSFPLQADNIGRWQIGSAPVGQYTITYKKTGCGTLVFRNIIISTTNPAFEILSGFQRMTTATLTKLPDAVFQNLALDLTTNQNGGTTTYTLAVNGTIIPGPPPNGQPKGYRVFVARTATVSKTNYEFQQHFTTLTENFSATIGSDVFSGINAIPGQTLYVTLYGDANFDLSQQNPNESFTFPNLTLEPSSTVSVVLP